MARASAFRNAGLKQNRLTKKTTSKKRVSAFDKSDEEKNQGSLLGGAGYLLGSTALGLGSVVEGATDIVTAAGDLLRGDTYMAKYRFQDNKMADAQEKLRESYNPGTVMGYAGDVASGIGTSLTFMIPYVGPYLAAAGFVGQGISGAAKKTGDVGLKELGYGLATGGMEFGLEALTAGMGSAAKNIGASVARKIGRETAESAAKTAGREALESTAKAVGKKAGKLTGTVTSNAMWKSVLKETGKGFAGEFAEEAAAEAIDPKLQRAFGIDENARATLGQIATAGIIGGISGSLMSAGPAAVNYQSAVKTGRKIRESGQTESILTHAEAVLGVANRAEKMLADKKKQQTELGADANLLQKTTAKAKDWSVNRKNSKAKNSVESLSNKVSRNLDAYRKYYENPNKSAQEKEASDALLGEMFGNVFALENATLLDVYEEAILEASEEDKEALTREFNERARAAGAKKYDYTVKDLEDNRDDILTAVAARRMQIDEYGLDFVDNPSPGKAEENAAEPAAEAAQAQGSTVATEAPATQQTPVTPPTAAAEAAKAPEATVSTRQAPVTPVTATEPAQGAERLGAVRQPTAQQNATAKEDEGLTRLKAKASEMGLGKIETDMMASAYGWGTELSPEDYATAYAEGVYYGKQNRSLGDIPKDVAFSRLTTTEKENALEAGRLALQADTERREAQVAEKKAPAREAGKKSYVTLDLKNGKRMRDMSDRDYATYKAAEILGEAMGTEIVITDTLGENEAGKINGYYDRKAGRIHVALDAGRDAKGTSLFTLAHESTHYIREWSPTEYQKLSDFVGSRMGESMSELIEKKKTTLRKMAEYRTATEADLTDAAQEEVVADAMETILSDGNVLEDLATYDKTLWEKVKAWINEVISRIKAHYKNLSPNSQAAKVLRESMDSMTELEEMFATAARKTGERTKAATQGDVTRMNEENMQVSEGGEKKHSFQGYAEDGKKIYESNFPLGTPKAAKSERILNYIQNVWSKKPIPLVISNGETSRTIYAQFDPTIDETQNIPTDASKLAGGNRHGTHSEQRVTLDLADDYYDIASSATYNYSKLETGKDLETHNGVVMWHYFVEDIYFAEYGSKETTPYIVTINVKEKADGEYVYSFNAEKESSTRRTLHADVNTRKGANGELFLDDSIPQEDDSVNRKFSISEENVSENTESTDVSENSTAEQLEAENKKLTEQLQKMRYERLQRAIKDGVISARVQRQELSKAADVVLDSIGVSDGRNRRELLRRMTELYERLAAEDPITYEQAFEEAGEIADWLISRQPEMMDAAMAEQAEEILKTLHGAKIRLTFAQKGEVAQSMGASDEYRKAMFGKVTVSDRDGVPLDVQWGEWVTEYPDVFSEDTAEADMPAELRRIYEDLMTTRDKVEPIEEYINADELTTTIFSEVAQIGWKAENTPLNDRTMLADAMLELVQSEQEYRILKEYKDNAGELAEAESRLKELKRQAAEVNRVIGALRDKIKGVEKSKREVWVMTALDEATSRKNELLREINELTSKINEATEKVLSIRAAKPLQRVIKEANRKADAMERSAERAREREEETREWAKDTVRKERERSNERVTEHKAELDRKADESKETKEITVRKRTVMRLLGSLETKIYHPTKTNHVPKELYDLAMKTLRAADPKAFEKNRSNIREMGELTAKIEKLERKAARTAMEQERLNTMKAKYEHLEEETMPLKKQAEALMTAFAEYNKGVPEGLQYPTEILKIMENRVAEIENEPLDRMNLRSLEAVETFVTMLSHKVDSANELFMQEREQTVSDTGDIAVKETLDSKELKFLSPKPGEIASLDGIRKYFWKNMKPLTAFEAIGSKTFTSLFYEVLKGEDVWARDIMEAREKILDARKRHGYDKWKLDERRVVKTASGDVRLSLSEIMSLYAYSFREQAISHLEGGGFVLDPGATEVAGGKRLSKPQLERRLNDSTRYVMNAETAGELAAMLTDEQKAYVEEMQGYLTGLGEKGNTVSRKLYGIDLFTEKHYFPIKVKSEYIKSNAGPSGDPNIKNRGMTKEVVPDAKDPLVLQGFDEIMVDHINSMATYHAFVLPVEDLTRVLNYKPSNAKVEVDGKWVVDESKKDDPTLKAVIESKYGAQANDYILQLLRDLNGGARRDAAAGLIDRGITAFKRASTMASLSVLVQQPTSIFRAMAYLDGSYLFGSSAGLNAANHKKLWEKVKKYAPVAIIKEMGGYDTGVGSRTGDFLNSKEYKTWNEKLQAFIKPERFGGDANYRSEVFGAGAAYADEMAWIQIFEGCVSEQADKLGKSRDSEEVLQAAGKRFEEIIRKTQVYDSTLSRSEYMRSKDTGAKMATAFMAEPTTVVSMMADAIIRGERGDTKFLRKSAGVVAVSILMNALAASLIYAARDDDEDETYAEKYTASLARELVDGVNPATYLPVARDIVSIMQGYEVERSDMTLIQNLMDQVEGITNSKRSVSAKMVDVGGAVAAFFGVPVTNVVRDARGLYNTFLGQVDTETTTGMGISTALKKEFTTIFGLFDEQTTDAYQLYRSALNEDGPHFARVYARYESTKAAELALRQAIRDNDRRIAEAAEAKISGELESFESIVEQIVAEGHFDRNIIIRAVNNEVNAIRDDMERASTVPRDEEAAAEAEEEESESLYSASDLNDALARGDKEDFEIVFYSLLADKKERGQTEAQAKASVKSSVTAYWKKRYLAAWEENDTAEMKRIQAVLLSTDLYGNRNDVATSCEGWVKAYAAKK